MSLFRVFKFIFYVMIVTLGSVHFARSWSEPKLFGVIDSKTNPREENELLSNNPIEEAPELTVGEAEKFDIEEVPLKIEKKMKWVTPDYSGQNQALGWSPQVFSIPPGMEDRVNFWVKIYTQYTTQQGVLHDSAHPAIVYEAIDFRPIENNQVLTAKEKRKARKNLVEGKKDEIRSRLYRLSMVSDPQTLSGEDLRLWNLFSIENDPNKFKAATHKKRLRFQLGQSDRFLQGIYYSGRYLKQMESIFRERGLPIELTRLPFVESSFNVHARSRVGASGIWQFMRYTGRRFMRIHVAADERNDPIRATEAAARLFRINYQMLNDWPLAVTGYNHGPAGVQRIVKKFNTNKIADLVDERHGRFGFASANFYASFLAALEVEKNANKYFGENVYWDQPEPNKEIQLSRTVRKVELDKWFVNDRERAKNFNPHLSRTFWQGYGSLSAKDFIRVPENIYTLVKNDLEKTPQNNPQPLASKNLYNLSAGEVRATASQTPTQELRYYIVGAGETLSDISQQFGVSLKRLVELNDIVNPRRIRSGQKILLPH